MYGTYRLVIGSDGTLEHIDGKRQSRRNISISKVDPLINEGLLLVVGAKESRIGSEARD